MPRDGKQAAGFPTFFGDDVANAGDSPGDLPRLFRPRSRDFAEIGSEWPCRLNFSQLGDRCNRQDRQNFAFLVDTLPRDFFFNMAASSHA